MDRWFVHFAAQGQQVKQPITLQTGDIFHVIGRRLVAPLTPPSCAPGSLFRENHNLPVEMYQVYVIELSKRVFSENAKFRQANPQFNGVLQCLYVGMTSKTPQERFQQHKTGYVNKKGHKLSAAIVLRYGAYLRPSLYDHLNTVPMTRSKALAAESKLAADLRRQGYAVWYN